MTTRVFEPEQGDTLVEVLIAVVIISMAVVALLGALVTAITSSAEHRSLSNIDTVLKSYAESAKYQIELASTPSYAPCASVVTSPQSSTTYNGVPIPIPIGLPAGWSPPYIVGIQYLTAAGSYDTQFQCRAQSPPGDEQLLTLGVTAPDGVSETLTIGLRSPT